MGKMILGCLVEWVTEDKIGGSGWSPVFLWHCRDRRLHPTSHAWEQGRC